MEHEGGVAGQGTNHQHRGDGQDQQQHGIIGRSLRPPTAVPPTVLLANMGEQQNYAQRLIAAGKRLQRRANETAGAVIEGEVLASGPLALPAHTVEPHWES